LVRETGQGRQARAIREAIASDRTRTRLSFGFRLAFDAPSRETVDAFHAAALKSGGVDCGKPGPRPDYGATYYAAFVIDLDGFKLEAVHR